MGINQIKSPIGILFLKKFTAEMLSSIVKENQTKRNIEVERIRQKLIPQKLKEEPILNNLIKTKIFPESLNSGYKASKKIKVNQNESPNKINLIEKLGNKRIENYKSPRAFVPIVPVGPVSPIVPAIPPQKKENKPIFVLKPQEWGGPKKDSDLNLRDFKRTRDLNEISPVAKSRPPYLIPEKIEIFLRDPSIRLIECMGPGRNLLVKKYNQINVTKTKLNQNEINELINNFSKHSKIPILNGILKAAVGDLVISGLLSNLNNSRFIIEKIIPRNQNN